MPLMYGIKNCDTMKKAQKWLEQHQRQYQFHDYRQQGLTIEMLQDFCQALSWQQLVNTRGTTWRGLEESQKHELDEAKAISLMLDYPALIKRPLLQHEGRYLCGFSDDSYRQFFNV